MKTLLSYSIICYYFVAHSNIKCNVILNVMNSNNKKFEPFRLLYFLRICQNRAAPWPQGKEFEVNYFALLLFKEFRNRRDISLILFNKLSKKARISYLMISNFSKYSPCSSMPLRSLYVMNTHSIESRFQRRLNNWLVVRNTRRFWTISLPRVESKR